MRAHALPIWLLWLTQGQGLTIPSTDNTVSSGEPEQLEKRAGNAEDVNNLLTTYASQDVIPATHSVKVKTTSVETGTAQVLPTLPSGIEPQTTGVVVSKVDSSQGPLLTKPIPTPTSLLKPAESVTINKRADPTGSVLAKMAAVDLFSNPIDTAAPPSMFTRRTDHPVPRTQIRRSGVVETNKFYANFFLGDQTGPTYTFPYSIAWAGGTGAAASWGLAISHVEASQRVYGPVVYNNANSYYLNPVGIQSIILSATDLGKGAILAIDDLTPYSARVMVKKNSGAYPSVQFPIHQGMAFVTCIYNGAVPLIQTGVYFKSVTRVSKDPKTNVAKYNILLEDGTTWRLYAYMTKGTQLSLKVTNNGNAQATTAFYGTIHVAKDPGTSGSEALLDNGAGVWATGIKSFSGSVSGSSGSYGWQWNKTGHPNGNIYVYALPHQVECFDAATTKGVHTALQLQTPTKGVATAILGSIWTMIEPSLPVGMGFDPWHPTKGSLGTLSTSAKAAIKAVAEVEVSQDMSTQTDLNSMYYSGKAFAKFAIICYTLNNLLGDSALAQAGLNNLKTAFAKFTTNKQQYPLYYESAWGGLVSSASYTTGDSGADFGNTYYNDHHFHYGYHVLAAAYIGSMDATWLAANKAWVNSLIRDYANPSSKDTYFPVSRMFDWYHGHSWAHGLFASLDGKDQESSSEDVMSIYAIKMWGTVIKDSAMVARANLQLAIMARTMGQYYLYKKSNTVNPASFIGNKVAGILFENKIDHTTYFGSNIEYIQGIHMIPLLPSTPWVRTPAFVQEEWFAFFYDGKVDAIKNAWKSIIWGSYSTVNAKAAYQYFNTSNFDSTLIDGGASRTWYMAYAALMGAL